MEIGLRDILNLAGGKAPAPPTEGLPSAAEVRARQQRLTGMIAKVGLYPLSPGIRQQFGVPLTPYLLPKTIAAARFVQKRPEVGARAEAPPALLSALVSMEPAVTSWEQALGGLEAAARHGVLLTLRGMSDRTDELTRKVDERLRQGGPKAERLRIRLSRVLQAQGQWDAVALARRDRLRRQREAGAEALESARAETRLLIGADRLAQAGLGDATTLVLPERPKAPVVPKAPPRPPTDRPTFGLGLGDGMNVTGPELLALALEAGALAEGLGVPQITEEEGEDLVLAIDPLVVVTANLYSLLLPQAPGATDELEGLHTGDLTERVALLGELIDLYREAGRGLRGARDGHVVVGAVGQGVVGRVLREVHALIDRPPSADAEALRGDAGDLLRLEEQEKGERVTAADRTRMEKATAAAAVESVDRQNRFLKTVLAMRNREGVSREELAEAVAAYEEIGGEQKKTRRTRR